MKTGTFALIWRFGKLTVARSLLPLPAKWAELGGLENEITVSRHLSHPVILLDGDPADLV